MKAYAPKFQVKLHKISAKLDPGWGMRDITPLLGEGSFIRTSKHVRDPAGTFTITLADKPYNRKTEAAPRYVSLYTMCAPMDVIEIFAAHDGSQDMVVLMRGFISDVRREETIGADGKPSRRVTISGHDFGKVLMQQMVHFTPIIDDAGQLNPYGSLAIYFADWLTPPLPKLNAVQVVEKFAIITQTYLHAIIGGTELAPNGGDSPYPVQSMTPTDGNSLQGYRPLRGRVEALALKDLHDISFRDFLAQVVDVGAFNELYMVDEADKSYLVCKPNYQHISESGGPVTITDQEVQAITTHRSDARVANWFEVEIPKANLVDATIKSINLRMTGKEPHVVSDANKFYNAESDYGWRPMKTNARLFPPDDAYVLKGNLLETERSANQTYFVEWLKERTQQLRDMNYRNAWLEDSVIKLRGNETLRIGENVTFQRGDAASSTLYIVKVEHEIRPFMGYFTTIHTERGTDQINFISEVSSDSDPNAYFGELNQKGVYQP